MKMDIPEEFSGSTDQTTIVKGKRTKRPRLSSSTSSTDFHNSSSPTTSISAISTSTEEDEDMANCLILLARGNNSPPPPPEKKKSGSRKFTEMATSASEGKIGIYVYECRTCNRTFPSFQALGGHRASHKKPKSTADYDSRNSPPSILPDHQREGEQLGGTVTPPPSIPQLPNKNWDNNHTKPKVHECSICGSEFGSGQALGGHMRRHRPAPPINSVATSSSNDSSSSPKNVLGLDLNLPAPMEEEKFHQFPAKQKLFAAAALVVDCHY